MSMRFPGGLIATSPVNARYPSGVWTQAQTAPYQAQNVWTRDQFWPYTTLLLQGDGAVNGAQNNTFLDSSSNNFTITRNGNTTQGSFTPYEQDGYWSNFFDGSGDNLTTPSNAALAFGSSDFTIEAWVNPSSKVKAYPSIFGNTVGFGSNYVSLQFDHDSAARKFRFWVYNANSGSPLLESPAAYSYSNWYHVAVTRSGSTFRMFIDGTLVVSATYSGAVDGGSSQVARIGGNATSDDDFAGTVSNFRIVKGTAVYTSAFTPSAAPLTAITNTSLLTCQSNRFKDNSTNNFTLTVNGNTSVQAFQPFPGATTWSASVLGGSGYFDGNGDELTFSTIAVGSSTAFCCEAWVYVNSLAANMVLFGGPSDSTGGADNVQISIETNGTVGAYFGGSYPSSAAGVITTGSWYHIAWTRSGTTGKIFVNGVEVASGSSTTAGNINRIGSIGSIGTRKWFNGYVSNARIVVGSAVYTSAFTPPTAPVTAITNTQLLTNFTNAGIYDNSMMNNLETVGNAQVSTSVVKYGTGSMYFDGSGDWLVAPISPNLQLGGGDFTIEFWVNGNSYSVTDILGSWYQGAYSYIIQINGSQVQLSNGLSTSYTFSGTFNTGTWYHVALCRSGSSLRCFQNGTQIGSTQTVSGSWPTATRPLYVAYNEDNSRFGVSSGFNGYIDDLRITKAARYITNFTPPIARLPAQ